MVSVYYPIDEATFRSGKYKDVQWLRDGKHTL